MEQNQKRRMGFAIAALVCGFLGIILHAVGWWWVESEPEAIALIPGILGFVACVSGIVFGLNALFRAEISKLFVRTRVTAIAGIVLSIIVLVGGGFSFLDRVAHVILLEW